MYSIKEIKKSQSKKQQKNSLRKEFIHNLHINKSDVYSPLVYANIEKYLMKEYGSKDKILDLIEDYIFSEDMYCNSYYYAGNKWAQSKVENSKDLKKIRFMMGALDLLIKDNESNYIVTDDKLYVIYGNIVGHITYKIAQELKRDIKENLALKITPAIRKEILTKGLSRIVHYLNNGLICYITAFKIEKNLQENRENNKNLENDISALGYGFIWLSGEYKEKDIFEESFCVINNKFSKIKIEEELLKESNKFVENMLMLSRKYKQDSIFIKFYLGNKQYQLSLLKQDGTIDKILSSSDLLEKINSKFVLKEIDYRYENGGYSGSGVMKAMALNLFMQNAKKNNFWK